jgi:hypothetical protein
MQADGVTFSDVIGDLAAKLAQTPSRQLSVLEQVCAYDGEIVTWTTVGDFAMTSILVVAVRVSHAEAKIVLDGTRVALYEPCGCRNRCLCGPAGASTSIQAPTDPSSC